MPNVIPLEIHTSSSVNGFDFDLESRLLNRSANKINLNKLEIVIFANLTLCQMNSN